MAPGSLERRMTRFNLLTAKSQAVATESERQEIESEIEKLREEMKDMTSSLERSAGSRLEDPGSIRRTGGKVSVPEKISGDSHEYTEMARKARLQGVVIVEVVVGAEGDVENARILKGLPMGLNEQALAAVKTYKFQPALEDGQPVRAFHILTLDFRLD